MLAYNLYYLNRILAYNLYYANRILASNLYNVNRISVWAYTLYHA